MYTIVGATGKIGSVITRKLLERGEKVRAIGRNAASLQELSNFGAEAFTGSIHDVEFLHRAFDGATAVFSMIPPNVQAEDFQKYSDMTGEALCRALSASRATYVVNLSSLGAEVPQGTGPIAGLHRQEQRLNRLDAMNILHLRPTFFMENLLANIPMIKAMGINGSAFRADLPIPMIATRDVADVATEHLLKLDFTGKTILTLLGEREVTMVEATRILCAAIGRPDVPYVQFAYEDAIRGMVQAGISLDVARTYAEMVRAFNDGLIRPVTRNAENTTPTSLEQFATSVFASTYGI